MSLSSDGGAARKIVLARAYIIERDRVALEFETEDGAVTVACSDVDARDFSKLVHETVEAL
jgi:hypothetical protein